MEQAVLADSVILPAPFLRGLEGDLRALCAEAKRYDTSVKDAAERVILQLKEADSAAASAAAADEAAAAFCAACAPIDASSSSAGTPNARVVIHSISSLHKLLTHRAVSPRRLPAIIDALQKLGVDSTDDSITLKVLQTLLSLLTVPAYVRALPKSELSRAISLLFMLRTSRSAAAAAAAGPLSAISAVAQKFDSGEAGVIEVTAQASFRQVASGLFAAATEALSSAENMGQSGSIESLASVVQSAFALFRDMSAVVAGDEVSWLTSLESTSASQPTEIGKVLALEVIDDGLSGNVVLFSASASPVFSNMLSSRLCPAVHELLLSDPERPVQKALFGLVVTLVREFWTDLVPDSEVLMACMVKLIQSVEPGKPPSWGSLYAMDAFCALLRPSPSATRLAEEHIVLSLLKAFDLRRNEPPFLLCDMFACVSKLSLSYVVDGLADVSSLPIAPLREGFKPFSTTSGNLYNVFVASAAGTLLNVCHAAKAANASGQITAFEKLLTGEFSSSVVSCLGALLSGVATPGLEHVLDGLVAFALASDSLATGSARQEVMKSICKAAIVAVDGLPGQETRVCALFRAAFAIEKECGERLGPVWADFVEALHRLDVALYGEFVPVTTLDKVSSRRPDVNPSSTSDAALAPLIPELEKAFSIVSEFSWSACGDLISALVVSSRTTHAKLSKRLAGDDAGTSGIVSQVATSQMRVFGIARAETVMTGIFSGSSSSKAETMPHGLWQLLTGHLVGIACDSPVSGMRATAVESLTKVASCALECQSPCLVPQDKVIVPMIDLLSSSHEDTREGCLHSVFTLLETRGEVLKGSAAWSTILNILRTGVEGSQVRKDESVSDESLTEKGVPSEALVQIGFRAIQLIADDFLSFLAFGTLSGWIRVVELYGKQHRDVNVALTAVGLLWRTGDHFAKQCGEAVYDSLWMDLFEVLKCLGADERPEVRNGAVKTLTGTLSAHGTRLTAAGWKGCVERALVPLLEDVMLGGSVDLNNHEAANSKGIDSSLVLHHSRDTPRKQWNETRVLALSGVASVLRKAMPHLASLHDKNERPLVRLLADGGSSALWSKMLRAACGAACSEENEVALAGVGALLELLNGASALPQDSSTDGRKDTLDVSDEASMGGKSLEPGSDTDALSGATAMCEAVWVSISEVVGLPEDGKDSSVITSEMALVTLAKGLGTVHRDFSGRFTPRSSVAFLDILSRLACGGKEVHALETSTIDSLGKRISVVPDTSLAVLESISFGSQSDSWMILVQKLLEIVAISSKGDLKWLTRRLVKLIESFYVGSELPDTVKAAKLNDVSHVFGGVMLRHHKTDFESSFGAAFPVASSLKSNLSVSPLGIGGSVRKIPSTPVTRTASGRHEVSMQRGTTDAGTDEPLWIAAVNGFQAVVLSGLKAGAPKVEFWTNLMEVSSNFLYGSWQQVGDGFLDASVLAELAVFEGYDTLVAICVRDALGMMSEEVSDSVQSGLVNILARGSQEGMGGKRPRYVRTCQSCLFALADAEWSGNHAPPEVRGKIAAQAAACVVSVSDSVLGRFVADSHRAGKCPMSAERRAEAVFLLRRLQSLRLSSHADDTRKYLRTLHPRLCECVDGGDEAVRLLAQATIQIVS